jgi:siroheme synthase (precorrin-2 oxidase/ferrochelatase)
VAVGLEQPLVKIADIGIKLIQKNSDVRMMTDTGQELIPALMAESKLKIRVAGHSHSPLFADEAKEQAAGLFKAQAIDREQLIRMLNPPNADNLIHQLRKRVKAEVQKAQQQAAMGGDKKGHKAA